jgi:hypothetical protein
VNRYGRWREKEMVRSIWKASDSGVMKPKPATEMRSRENEVLVGNGSDDKER